MLWTAVSFQGARSVVGRQASKQEIITLVEASDANGPRGGSPDSACQWGWSESFQEGGGDEVPEAPHAQPSVAVHYTDSG